MATTEYTVRLGDDLAEWVDTEAAGTRSKAQVVRDAVRAVAQGDGPYADSDDDGDLARRVDALTDRLADIESRLDDHDDEIDKLADPTHSLVRTADTDESDTETVREEIADRLADADLSDAMYSPTESRIDAATDAFAVLADRRSATTAELVEVVEESDADVSAANRLLGDFGAALDSVETPGRGSNRYQWRGE